MEPPDQRTGIMVLRAWLEVGQDDGQDDGLRVRILSAVGQDQAVPIAVSSPEAVHEAVRSWLEKLRSSPNDVSMTPR